MVLHCTSSTAAQAVRRHGGITNMGEDHRHKVAKTRKGG